MDAENNIIISDHTIREIMPPQLKNIYAHHKVMCGCDCFVYEKLIHSYLLSWSYFYM